MEGTPGGQGGHHSQCRGQPTQTADNISIIACVHQTGTDQVGGRGSEFP